MVCKEHKNLQHFPANCFHAKSEKTISSLPILWTEASADAATATATGVASCCATYQYFHQPLFVKCGCGGVLPFGGGATEIGAGYSRLGAISGDGKCKYLFCSTDHKRDHTGGGNSRHCYDYETLNPIPSATSQGPSLVPLSRSEQNVNSVVTTVRTVDSHHQQQRSEPLISTQSKPINEVICCSGNNINCAFSSLQPFKDRPQKRRQSSQSSSSDSGVNGAVRDGVPLPKIEIVICTEVHGSVETKVIRRPETQQRHPQQRYNNNRNRIYRRNCKLVSIPVGQFRRAVSDSPRVIVMEGTPRDYDDDDESSIHSAPEDGSMDSTSSIIVDSCVRRNCSKKHHRNVNRICRGGGGNYATGGGDSPREGGSKSARGRKRFKLLAYLSQVANCCGSRSTSSLLSHSGSGENIGDSVDHASGEGGGGGSLPPRLA